MNYKNAEKCHKCPQRNDDLGCPWWWEYVQANAVTGDERVQKQCGKAALPIFLTEVIRAANRPAAEISAMRDSVTKKVVELSAMVVTAGTGLIAEDNKIPLGDNSSEHAP